MPRLNRCRFLVLLLILSLLVLVGCTVSLSAPDGPPGPDGRLAVHFIDVGQGDAALVQTPSGGTVIIDGGDRAAGKKVVEYLRKQGVDTIDVMVSTHPHADHIGGLITVLERFPVKKVVDPGVPHTTQTYEEYLTLLLKKDVEFIEGGHGMEIEVDPVITLEIYGPVEVSEEDLNNSSIVIRLAYVNGDFSVLFTGDMMEEAEKTFCDLNVDVRSTVLKVGHHGSRASTSKEFLQRVSPEAAVISSGAGNSYGHPHPETLQRLSGLSVYRTDRHGDVVIRSDGRTYKVWTSRNENG
ncbi:MAG: MBL fold metallo-hydrolase [Desulforudis sp.]|jgi:beta-lactamase superfamily II metal-dependent hydrolase|nr:MAG: MBL fold metallo-hydrolase [Desulforudis sp.]